jgi:mRNA-degrading endonuclease HigB of HigAB toxin-antitoxin module
VEEMNKLNFDTNKKTLKEIWKQDEETEDSLKKWFDKIKNN